MSVAQQSHTATFLPDGTVLLAGGFNGDYLESAEVYDPATGVFTPLGSMTMARSGHVAVFLNNGKVLLAGGTGEGWLSIARAKLLEVECLIQRAQSMKQILEMGHDCKCITIEDCFTPISS